MDYGVGLMRRSYPVFDPQNIGLNDKNGPLRRPFYGGNDTSVE